MTTATAITVTVTGNGPKWVVNMAREYAAERGLETIDLKDFYATDEYQSQVSRNMQASGRTTDADIRANR